MPARRAHRAAAAPIHAGNTPACRAQPASANGQSWHEDDLIGAAEGVFGKGAKGLAMMIRDILKKQGEPIGYITGREAGGALVVGLRYGSGTLHHKVEGDMPVYWTGPSVVSMPGPMPATPSCWSTTFTIRQTCTTALARARGKPT
jgi:hypothetical protein